MNKNQKILPSQIKLIHIAKSQLKISDENYRELLAGFCKDHESWSVASSKELTSQQAEDLLKIFEKLGFKITTNEKFRKYSPGIGKLKYEELANRGEGWPAPKQLRKVEVLWHKNSREKTDSALQAFIKRICGVDLITAITQQDIHKLIKAIENLKVKI
jgi:hypothetical protein